MFGILPFNRKPRQFTYKARHYDPDQEARESRRRELFGEDASSGTEGTTYKPGQIVRGARFSRYHRDPGTQRKSNSRLFVIFIVLVVVIFLLFR